MLEPGARVAVALPPHWLGAVAVLGAWTAGLTVTADPADPVDVSFEPLTPAGGLTGGPAAPGRAGTRLVTSLHPWGLRVAGPLPPGCLDVGAEVPPQPDVLLSGRPVPIDGPAWFAPDRAWTLEEVGRVGRDAADRAGLAAAGRLLTDLNPAAPEGLLTTLVGPLVVGASVVLLTTQDDSRRTAIATQERTTAAAWRAG